MYNWGGKGQETLSGHENWISTPTSLITQHSFNPVVTTKSMDLCILILGYLDPKTHFLQKSGVPFTVSDDEETVYTTYRDIAYSE